MPESQTRRTVFLAALALVATALLLAVLLRAAPITHAAQNAAKAEAPASVERWLHVAVDCKDDDGQRVRVNVPISLARSVLAAVQHGPVDHGIVHIHNAHINDVDIRAILKALKTTPDGEFVTVEEKDTTVRVKKEGGLLLIHVVDTSAHHKNHAHQNVDVRLPLEVADALFSGPTDELNVAAALDLLARHTEMELVSVQDAENTVRVWMNTKTTQD